MGVGRAAAGHRAGRAPAVLPAGPAPRRALRRDLLRAGRVRNPDARRGDRPRQGRQRAARPGGTQILEGTRGEYVVHPPLGKMLIAVGEWLFGLTPFGWRFAVAVAGSLAILMTER